jgi:23S rRNA (cytidine1920-2'-O)/16S rRNA (cytidine1409-2'-O)-methyltransferase
VSRRLRLDAEMVRRGLVSSRAEAARAVGEQRVLVNGAVADKTARLVDPADALVLEGPPPRFVSRGGEKLDGALTAFGVDVAGRDALDAGASTGGFTDCLLQRGARHVVALDVGHGQLHPKVRSDARVTVFERVNIRSVTRQLLPIVPTVVVADLSFISLTRAIPVLADVAAPNADLVLLVKPQFEAGRAEVARGRGVITDPAIHERVKGEVADALALADCTVREWADSPITGADGNREFLVHATTAIAPRAIPPDAIPGHERGA